MRTENGVYWLNLALSWGERYKSYKMEGIIFERINDDETREMSYSALANNDTTMRSWSLNLSQILCLFWLMGFSIGRMSKLTAGGIIINLNPSPSIVVLNRATAQGRE